VARATITNLLQFIKIASYNQSTIEQTLNLDYDDYKDAVQMISAVQCKAECLVTRHVKDYQLALVPVMQLFFEAQGCWLAVTVVLNVLTPLDRHGCDLLLSYTSLFKDKVCPLAKNIFPP
jgi:hypothetical protein